MSKNSKDKNGRAHHQAYMCSGIQHCEYAHPDVLRTCEAYDQVRLENINHLQQQSGRPHFALPIEEKIKQSTEGLVIYNIDFYILIIYSYYHAFMKNWNQHSNPCIHPSTETRVCAGQTPCMFLRNEVGMR